MGVRVLEDGQPRIVETGEFRVTEEFNRAFANLAGTSTIVAFGEQIVIVIDFVTTATFSLVGTDVTDHLVPFVNSKPDATILVLAKDREFEVLVSSRVIYI